MLVFALSLNGNECSYQTLCWQKHDSKLIMALALTPQHSQVVHWASIHTFITYTYAIKKPTLSTHFSSSLCEGLHGRARFPLLLINQFPNIHPLDDEYSADHQYHNKQYFKPNLIHHSTSRILKTPYPQNSDDPAPKDIENTRYPARTFFHALLTEYTHLLPESKTVQLIIYEPYFICTKSFFAVGTCNTYRRLMWLPTANLRYLYWILKLNVCLAIPWTKLAIKRELTCLRL